MESLPKPISSTCFRTSFSSFPPEAAEAVAAGRERLDEAPEEGDPEAAVSRLGAGGSAALFPEALDGGAVAAEGCFCCDAVTDESARVEDVCSDVRCLLCFVRLRSGSVCRVCVCVCVCVLSLIHISEPTRLS